MFDLECDSQWLNSMAYRRSQCTAKSTNPLLPLNCNFKRVRFFSICELHFHLNIFFAVLNAIALYFKVSFQQSNLVCSILFASKYHTLHAISQCWIEKCDSSWLNAAERPLNLKNCMSTFSFWFPYKKRFLFEYVKDCLMVTLSSLRLCEKNHLNAISVKVFQWIKW